MDNDEGNQNALYYYTLTTRSPFRKQKHLVLLFDGPQRKESAAVDVDADVPACFFLDDVN